MFSTLHFFDLLFHGLELILQLVCIAFQLRHLLGFSEKASSVTVSVFVHIAPAIIFMSPVMPTAATFFTHILSHLGFLLILLEVKHLNYQVYSKIVAINN